MSPAEERPIHHRSGIWTTILHWFDNETGLPLPPSDEDRVDWLRTLPFILMHLGCLGIFFFGFSWAAVSLAIGLYLIRMFAITAFYHRYFSHRAFKTSRAFQFLFALIGSCSIQRSPIWWAAHHRHHHAHSDAPTDTHSPVQKGFLWSHMVWFLCRQNFTTRKDLIRDWMKFPELVFLDRYDTLVPALFGVAIYGLGEALQVLSPGWNTNGAQFVSWGFFLSTVALYHATFTVNSLAHVWGTRRYATRDDSRNNPLLALITLGEGWHNNHHHYPGAVRQGFFWWELDPTYYVLRLMATLGLVWDLRPLPERWRDRDRIDLPTPPQISEEGRFHPEDES